MPRRTKSSRIAFFNSCRQKDKVILCRILQCSPHPLQTACATYCVFTEVLVGAHYAFFLGPFGHDIRVRNHNSHQAGLEGANTSIRGEKARTTLNNMNQICNHLFYSSGLEVEHKAFLCSSVCAIVRVKKVFCFQAVMSL